MSKMKRILALTICLLMTITSLPVFADDTATETPAGIIALHENNFTSTDDMAWTFSSNDDGYLTTAVEDGGYKIVQSNSAATGSIYPGGNRQFGNFVVESNADNRTETVATAIGGKMRIDIDFEAYITRHPNATTNGYMTFSLIDAEIVLYS